jgi:hypothetical protein
VADVPIQTIAVGTQVQGNIVPAGAPGAGALEIEWVPSKLKMIQISSGELDAVLSSSASIHIGFLGISLGGLVSLGSTLATVPIADPSTYAAFVALTGLSVILSIYFGLRAGFGHWAYRKRLKALKGEA